MTLLLLPIELNDNLTEVELDLLRQVHTNRSDPESLLSADDSVIIKNSSLIDQSFYYQYAVQPLSAAIHWPFMKLESSEAKNKAI